MQQTHKLLNTGWALATIDNKTSGLVPINYVRRVGAKAFASDANQPVIEPELPINENNMGKNIETNFDEQISEMCSNKMPPNELIDEINPIILDDIKDL